MTSKQATAELEKTPNHESAGKHSPPNSIAASAVCGVSQPHRPDAAGANHAALCSAQHAGGPAPGSTSFAPRVPGRDTASAGGSAQINHAAEARPSSETVAASYLAIADPFLRKIAQDNARCHYRDSAARRCRRDRMRGHPTYCFRHAEPKQSPAEDQVPPGLQTGEPANPGDLEVWEALIGPLEALRTAAGINFTLGRLLLLKAQKRVSSKDASVIAYICQLLLQSLPILKKELGIAEDSNVEREQIRDALDATASLFDRDEEPQEEEEQEEEPPSGAGK